MGRYIRGTVDEKLVLGTLASLAVISGQFDETVNERTRVTSIVATYSMNEFTVAAGDGPVQVGVCHSDYSSAEIEEVLEATGSWDEGDLIQQELAKRKIRRIGIFDSDQVDDVLNDGKPIKTKLNWILNQGQSLRLWAYNTGAGALDTGAIINVNGHVNLFPQ